MSGSRTRPGPVSSGPGFPVPDQHLGRGQGGLARIPIGGSEFLPDELDYSISAGSGDAWHLQHGTAWVERAESGAIVLSDSEPGRY